LPNKCDQRWTGRNSRSPYFFLTKVYKIVIKTETNSGK
jgi:hypothetical protein